MTAPNSVPVEVALPLPVLLRDLAHARAVLAQRRHGGAARGSVDDAREQMVVALSSYTAALAAHRLPVPYALRDELRIQLRVSGRR